MIPVPFGPDCEFKKWSDCTKKYKDKKDPDAYCAEIQKATEDHCKKDQARRVGVNVTRLSAAKGDVSLMLPEDGSIKRYQHEWPGLWGPIVLVRRSDRSGFRVTIQAAPHEAGGGRPDIELAGERGSAVSLLPGASAEFMWVEDRWVGELS